MGIGELREFFLWGMLLNTGILLVWWGFWACAGEWVYRIHSRWFPMPRETFTVIHYAGLGLYKMGTLLVTLVPYLALLLVG